MLERIPAPDGQRFFLRDTATGDIWYCRPLLAMEHDDARALMEAWSRREGSGAGLPLHAPRPPAQMSG